MFKECFHPFAMATLDSKKGHMRDANVCTDRLCQVTIQNKRAYVAWLVHF